MGCGSFRLVDPPDILECGAISSGEALERAEVALNINHVLRYSQSLSITHKFV